MDDAKMVHQANQIAAYFEAYPQARAREGVLDHLHKFWPPDKRARLAAYLAGNGGGLHPLAAWAAAQLEAPAGQD
ncbi:hypothetical protein KBTX_01892 [wastewater metagenome]|uniref:Uncharacterized protein n=2 Tax=unclassified sequences TaxID=12908 RepID=A0A5B8R8V4_9ZZZZ|nr:formate dehydrogenase subunit delta [Arhodomonas aquaeolei]MCS4505762.1 formate dehydrogenase subunit delta [Arhodomonas aquaeolei]QEA05569.1 hypothetical protein KBTEX_01892 [uncultured organism]